MDKIKANKTSGVPALARGRGFTLVELMIVVVLVAALAAFSTPTILASMERNRLTQLNRDVANGFLEARSYAMRQGRAVYIDINSSSSDGPNGSIIFYEAEDAGGGFASSCARGAEMDPDANNTLITIRPEERGLDVVIEAADVDTVCIGPTGRVTTEYGQPIAASASDCDDLNLLIPIIAAGDTESDVSDLMECDPSTEQSVKREVDKFSMIHVAYGGQVRVIR